MDKKFEEQCPSNDYEQGQPHGKCWGDGHYKCKGCRHYREDFKRLGQDYIDFVHIVQRGIQITTVKTGRLCQKPDHFPDVRKTIKTVKKTN